MTVFPEPRWFLALGERMAAESELFRRLGYAETRFAVRVIPDNGNGVERMTGVVFDGYRLVQATALEQQSDFDPDFVIVGRAATWDRMLDEIHRDGRPHLRHTLNSLVLIGEEMWLESVDQLREDKFYRFNQTLQEFFNLASHVQKPSA